MFLDLEPVLSRRKENAATNLAGAHWEDAIIPRAELLIITQHDWPTKWKSGIISKTAISIKKSTRKIHWTHITLAYTHTSICVYIYIYIKTNRFPMLSKKQKHGGSLNMSQQHAATLRASSWPCSAWATLIWSEPCRMLTCGWIAAMGNSNQQIKGFNWNDGI